MNYIISSHGKKSNKGKFEVPYNVTLKFYCADDCSLSMTRGYAVFGLIYNWKEYKVHPVDVINSGQEVDNYILWNGNFRSLAEDDCQDVNGIFAIDGDKQLPCIENMGNDQEMTLRDAIEKCKWNSKDGNPIVIHCLFCRA